MPKHYLLRTAGFLFGIMMIASLNSIAQSNSPIGSAPLKYVNPSQYGFVLQDISFVDNNTGLGVGVGNAGSGLGSPIAKTADGGLSWQYIFLKYITPANQVALGSFSDVHFVTPAVAYAVGSSGLMVKTTDGGTTWTRIVTPLTALNRNINALHFINRDTGYIGGAAINTTNTTNINDAPKVYFTKDGGASWDSLVTPFVPNQTTPTLNWNNQKEIWRIHFANDSVGYVCGSAGAGQSSLLWKIEKGVITDYSIHRTKFGLVTGNPSQTSTRYIGLVAVNDSLVLMGGTNGIGVRVKTGKNDSTANPVPAIYGPYSRGTYQVILQLNTVPPIPANLTTVGGQINHMKKTPDGKILAQAGKYIIQSADNGTTWTVPGQPSIPQYWFQLNSLEVASNGRVIVGGSSGILFDSLPGASWRTQYKNIRPYTDRGTGTGVNTGFDFAAIDFADCENGVVVGSYGTIVKTNDGGKTWVNNSSNVLEASGLGISNVSYQKANNLFFTTFNSVWRSTDQGTTNNTIFTEPNTATQGFNTNYFTMVDENRAFVAAFRGGTNVQRAVIFRTLNASAPAPVWDTVKTFPNGTTFAPNFRNIKFANVDTGYVTATRGKVYRTVDGGNTWTDVSPDTTAAGNSTAVYTALSVVNGKILYVGGSSRKLFKSTDAGVTWTDLTLPLSTPTTFVANTAISNIVMNDVNNGYLTATVNSAGTFLLKTSDGWTTWSYDMTPLAVSNMLFYPKMGGPIENKKLYLVMGPQAHTFFGSQNSPTLMEYGDASKYTVSTAETSTAASCTNPTAGTITVTATGGIAPYTYSIDGGAFQSSNVFTGLTTGNKTVVIKDAGCQVITKTINVGFTDNLTLSASNDTTVCAGAPVQLQATATTGATFTWTPAAGLSNAGISNPLATVNTQTTFTVTASLNGCVKTEPVSIAIKPNPAVNAGADKTIVDGEEVQLLGSASNAVSVAWTPANTLRDANTFSPTARPSATTTYTMTVKNAENCTSTDDVKITVLPYCVKVMNAFSPNGDGANDRWIVTSGTGCTDRIKVAVFNRYGQQVYVNENYQNTWDGTFNGKPVPDGTYYYAITYFLINGRTATANGDVTILR